jgi:hypothetical protein
MRLRTHFNIFAQAVLAWFGFWLLGLPDYYQQYYAAAVGIGSVILSAAISVLFLFILLRIAPERRLTVAFWLSFYYTLPFALLDTWYCGVYLGHGSSYLLTYWYLTVFYFWPWLTLIPMAVLLQRQSKRLLHPSRQTPHSSKAIAAHTDSK